jgi:hypothetical protein
LQCDQAGMSAGAITRKGKSGTVRENLEMFEILTIAEGAPDGTHRSDTGTSR